MARTNEGKTTSKATTRARKVPAKASSARSSKRATKKTLSRETSKVTSSQASKPGFDEVTAARIRAVLADQRDVVEKRMFGGLCFMVNGQMCCGLTKTDFMVRVGKDGFAAALAQPHARPMDFTGRPSTGMVYVDPAGYKTEAALAAWVGRGVKLVTANRPKRKRAR